VGKAPSLGGKRKTGKRRKKGGGGGEGVFWKLKGGVHTHRRCVTKEKSGVFVPEARKKRGEEKKSKILSMGGNRELLSQQAETSSDWVKSKGSPMQVKTKKKKRGAEILICRRVKEKP